MENIRLVYSGTRVLGVEYEINGSKLSTHPELTLEPHKWKRSNGLVCVFFVSGSNLKSSIGLTIHYIPKEIQHKVVCVPCGELWTCPVHQLGMKWLRYMMNK